MIYLPLKSNENVFDFGWPRQIGDGVNNLEGDIILVGHSLGASATVREVKEGGHLLNNDLRVVAEDIKAL